MSRELERYDSEKPEHVQQHSWVAPRVDIYENEDEVLLLADVPGVDTKGLKINLENGVLTLEGSVEDSTPGDLVAGEYRAANYRRSFTVPAGIDENKVSAKLRDGVLALHLPKSAALKPRQIQVRAG